MSDRHLLHDVDAVFHFTEVNVSGRFTQTPTQFAHQLAPYRAIASLIAGSEVDNPHRSRVLLVPGWGSVFGDISGRDDCFVTWDQTIWREVWADTKPLSHRTYIDERGHRTGITAGAFAVLDHRETGYRLVKGYAHTPHGMQDDLRSGHVRTDVGLAYLSITRSFRNRALHLQRRFDADGIDISADWNLNAANAWVRAWFHAYRHGTGLALNWRPPYPDRGTFGGMFVDATLYSRRTLSLSRPSTVLPRAQGDDHCAYENQMTGTVTAA